MKDKEFLQWNLMLLKIITEVINIMRNNNRWIKGKIKKIKFRSSRNNFTVMIISNRSKDVKVVGKIPSPKVGFYYKFLGKTNKKAKYGEQFEFIDYNYYIPKNKYEFGSYLYNIIEKLSATNAEHIINDLGDNSYNIIQEEPDILIKYPFIEKHYLNKLKIDLKENIYKPKFINKLTDLGLKRIKARTIWGYYRKDGLAAEDILDQFKQNPYKTINEIKKLKFKNIDNLALKLAINKKDGIRIKAAIEEVLKISQEEGHSYLMRDDLIIRLNKLLNSSLEWPYIKDDLKALAKQEKIVVDNKKIYIKFLYTAEEELSYQINQLINKNETSFSKKKIKESIAREEKKVELKFAPKQKEAIKKALNNNLSVITGGPGTGKSEIIKSICSIYENKYKEHYIHLASPTGKASNKLKDLTNITAKTIHRLLRYKGKNFVEHYELPSPGILVIDEFSMTDLNLAYHLFIAINNNLKVVIVGDTDQLPSIGAGNILGDMISSEKIPTTTLTENFRQSEDGFIIPLANDITQGKLPELNDNSDFRYLSFSKEKVALNEVSNVFKRLPDTFNIFDIQVITPVNNGTLGVKNLNKVIKKAINPNLKDVKSLDGFNTNDKVMVTKNHYEKEVYNGEFGQITDITSIDNTKAVRVKLKSNDEEVIFKRGELNYLRHAYACTVHKSQGSEFEFLIMILSSSHKYMLRRNLFYTGITRTKKKLFLLSNENALKKAVKNNSVENRNSSLSERIDGGKVVSIGDKVKLKDYTLNESITYQIVKEKNNDPLNYKISPSTSLGKNLISRKIGYTFDIYSNRNKHSYEILDIAQ